MVCSNITFNDFIKGTYEKVSKENVPELSRGGWELSMPQGAGFRNANVSLRNKCCSYSALIASLGFDVEKRSIPNVKYIASGKQSHSTGRSARCFVTT